MKKFMLFCTLFTLSVFAGTDGTLLLSAVVKPTFNHKLKVKETEATFQMQSNSRQYYDVYVKSKDPYILKETAKNQIKVTGEGTVQVNFVAK